MMNEKEKEIQFEQVFIDAVSDFNDALYSASEVEFFLWYGFVRPSKDVNVIVVSDDLNSAVAAADTLRTRGYRNVRHFPGGIVGWKKCGGPTVSS